MDNSPCNGGDLIIYLPSSETVKETHVRKQIREAKDLGKVTIALYLNSLRMCVSFMGCFTCNFQMEEIVQHVLSCQNTAVHCEVMPG